MVSAAGPSKPGCTFARKVSVIDRVVVDVEIWSIRTGYSWIYCEGERSTRVVEAVSQVYQVRYSVGVLTRVLKRRDGCPAVGRNSEWRVRVGARDDAGAV